ncbi:MAG: hypothetical protein BGO39_22065 [Chloroflexi bacterium 54-19]|nr:MAG: hypothetical protein BGO39_22065 [Chloroflexi bacterium 54-19]
MVEPGQYTGFSLQILADLAIIQKLWMQKFNRDQPGRFKFCIFGKKNLAKRSCANRMKNFVAVADYFTGYR